DRHIARAPRRVVHTWPRVLVALGEQLFVERLQLVGLDAQGGPRRGVAEMPGQVEHANVLRDLHVERRALLEPVLPIDGETKKIDVELPRLVLVEYPQDWFGLRESHQRPPSPIRLHHARRTVDRICTGKLIANDERQFTFPLPRTCVSSRRSLRFF